MFFVVLGGYGGVHAEVFIEPHVPSAGWGAAAYLAIKGTLWVRPLFCPLWAGGGKLRHGGGWGWGPETGRKEEHRSPQCLCSLYYSRAACAAGGGGERWGEAARLQAPQDPHPTQGMGAIPACFEITVLCWELPGPGTACPLTAVGGGGVLHPSTWGAGGAQPMRGCYQSTALSRWAKPGSRRSFQ